MKSFLQSQLNSQNIEIIKLKGYDNSNYRVLVDGTKYIFKTYQFTKELFELITAESEILLLLQKQDNNKFPKPIPFSDGSFVKIENFNGQKLICRLLSFLEGEFMGDIISTKEMYKSFGKFVAELDLKLQNITNSTIELRKCRWDIQYYYYNKDYINDIPDVKDRETVIYFFKQFEENALPILKNLRKAIIHSDANEWNTLVKDNRVSGIIDFGDLVYSQLINELGIAITYACFFKDNPLEWASIIIKFYHKVLPLQKNEISILYYIIGMRLCVSYVNASHSKKENPENIYAASSMEPVKKMLDIWVNINPVKAKTYFCSAVGL